MRRIVAFFIALTFLLGTFCACQSGGADVEKGPKKELGEKTEKGTETEMEEKTVLKIADFEALLREWNEELEVSTVEDKGGYILNYHGPESFAIPDEFKIEGRANSAGYVTELTITAYDIQESMHYKNIADLWVVLWKSGGSDMNGYEFGAVEWSERIRILYDIFYPDQELDLAAFLVGPYAQLTGGKSLASETGTMHLEIKKDVAQMEIHLVFNEIQ